MFFYVLKGIMSHDQTRYDFSTRSLSTIAHTQNCHICIYLSFILKWKKYDIIMTTIFLPDIFHKGFLIL